MSGEGTADPHKGIMPDKREILIQLDAVCRSQHFRQSPKLVNVLRFLVDTELDGQDLPPSSKDIALNVFGKGNDFRSKSDSSVRVACNRLRKTLSLYNAQVKPKILISLSPGSNRPSFQFNQLKFDVVEEALFLAERYQSIASRSAHRFAMSRVCLALEQYPESAELLAASADLILDGYKHGYQRKSDQLEEAIRCADFAYAIDENSAKVLLSRAMISLELGQLAEVRLCGQSMMALDDEEAVLFGTWMYDVVSETPEDLYEEHAAVCRTNMPGWLHHTRFLSAYSAKDYESALTEAIGFGMNEFFWGAVERAAALGQLGLLSAGASELERALDLNPDLTGNFDRYLRSYIPHQNVRMHVLDGIERVSSSVL